MQYMSQLGMPSAYQNPPDTPHPGMVLQERMKGQWGKENPDEVAAEIMRQEMIRDVISKHLYYQRGANELSERPGTDPNGALATRGMRGDQIPSRLGRDGPMYDPMMEMLESLDQSDSDIPMY
jgi:hypothetical protein